ncbi:hypothetical protein GCM10010191_92760 [Actinomadura vinacea]|uniref:Uncharacterized protein n=1 Tax=Actinomadura vinacea TaxID=115336 RepID=A0ABN3KFE3_9ACTN
MMVSRGPALVMRLSPPILQLTHDRKAGHGRSRGRLADDARHAFRTALRGMPVPTARQVHGWRPLAGKDVPVPAPRVSGGACPVDGRDAGGALTVVRAAK